MSKDTLAVFSAPQKVLFLRIQAAPSRGGALSALLRPGSVCIAIIFLLYLKLHISEVQDAKMVEVGPNV